MARTQQRPRQVAYTRVGENRGRRRVWMEGKRLERCGFVPGAAYRLEVAPERGYLKLTLDPGGDRIVSSRRRGERELPIVDLCFSEFSPPGTKLRAVMIDGVVEVTLHHEELALADRRERLAAGLRRGELKEGSLCTGAGVSALASHEGFREAGLPTTLQWVADIDGRYLDIAAAKNPAITDETVIFNAALEEIETALATPGGDYALDPVDVLTFSLPCDGHSRAGRSKRGLGRAESHPASATSVFGLIRILDAANPSALISENVIEARDSATYELITRELERRNYHVQDIVLDGSESGSLEHRRRWFFIALSKDIAEGFDIERVIPSESVREAIAQRLDGVLEGISREDERWRHYDHLYGKQARDAAAGKGFRPQVYSGGEARVSTLRKFYQKAGSTDPRVSELSVMTDAEVTEMANRVSTEDPGAERLAERLREWVAAGRSAEASEALREVITDPALRAHARERIFTAREHARIKGIPEALIEGVGEGAAHELLGQSVLFEPVRALSRIVAEHLSTSGAVATVQVIRGGRGEDSGTVIDVEPSRVCERPAPRRRRREAVDERQADLFEHYGP